MSRLTQLASVRRRFRRTEQREQNHKPGVLNGTALRPAARPEMRRNTEPARRAA